MNEHFMKSNQKTKKCPNCESNHVTTSEEQEHFFYGTESNQAEISVIVPVHTCADCSFQFTDHEADQIRHNAVCEHLGVLNPSQIKEIRQKYGLARSEFSKITALGEASLHRWENGLNIQNSAYDQYLYLLSFEENFSRIRRKKECRTEPKRVNHIEEKSESSIKKFKYLDHLENMKKQSEWFELHRTG